MSKVFPFKALRPQPARVAAVAALPYDVLSVEEAKVLVRCNPWSFLRVEKSEVDLPFPGDVRKGKAADDLARRNLSRMRVEGTLIEEDAPCYYLYRLHRGDTIQTGVVACVGTDEYEAGRIRKHEQTRVDKEQERIRHVEAAGAHTGLVFLTYRGREEILAVTDRLAAAPPLYDFVSEDGTGHMVWAVRNPGDMEELQKAFSSVDVLYIADGHHRAAAAAAVAEKRRKDDPDLPADAAPCVFPAALFPCEEVCILDYNRAVRDLHGMDPALFLRRVGEKFILEPDFADRLPAKPHEFGMYLKGAWYRLTAKEGTYSPTDPVDCLDVSILQDRLLDPLLGIRDPRTDGRIHFIGGIRGVEELERLVNGGEYAVAFSLYPTTVDQLMAVADAGLIMPPKSTWFEPKLRSGLFVHPLA